MTQLQQEEDRYSSENAKRRALLALNRGEESCKNIMRSLEEIRKEVDKRRLEFLFVRTVVYGRGKGKTGKRKHTREATQK
jgi:hypothetical protein